MSLLSNTIAIPSSMYPSQVLFMLFGSVTSGSRALTNGMESLMRFVGGMWVASGAGCL